MKKLHDWVRGNSVNKKNEIQIKTKKKKLIYKKISYQLRVSFIGVTMII